MVVKDAFPARNLQLQKLSGRETPRPELSSRRNTQGISMDQLVERYNLPVGHNQQMPPMGWKKGSELLAPVTSRSSRPSARPSTAHQREFGRQSSNGSRGSMSSRERPQSAKSYRRVSSGSKKEPNMVALALGGTYPRTGSLPNSRTSRCYSSPERSYRRQSSFRDRPSSPEIYSDSETDRSSEKWAGNPGLGVHGNTPVTMRGHMDRQSTSSKSSMNMSRNLLGVSQMLKDKIRNKAASSVVELREAFRHFNRDGDAEISFEEFCRVLREQHISMSETEARALFRSFDTDGSGQVSFEEFQSWLYDGVDIAADAFAGGGGTRQHRAMSISKQKMITAQERMNNLKSRLNKEDMERLDEIFREKLWNSISEGSTRVLRAFRRIHTGRGLVITYEEFKRSLKEHSINLNEEELVEFWDHFQPIHGGADFNHFRQWLVPQSELERPVTPPDPRYKDQVLRAKIKSTIIRAPYQLMRTFREVKTTPGSSINKAEFNQVCNKFGISFTPEEIDAFYNKFDEDRSGEIDYLEFCNWITESHSSPLASIDIGDDAKNRDKKRMAKAMERAHRDNHLNAHHIANFDKLLREKILGSLAGGGHELIRAFRKIHTGTGPVITFKEFKKAVLDYGFNLHDEEIQLMFSHFSDSKKGGLDYKGFCTWIMDSGKQDFTSIAALQNDQNLLNQTGGRKGPSDVDSKMGTVNDIKQVIRQRVNNSSDGPQFLMRAFLKGHRAQGLNIPFSTFKSGLEEFSVRATDIALLDLFAEYDRNQTGFINYKEFVLSFQDYEDEQKEKMKRNPIGVQEAEHRIRDLDRHRPGMWQAELEGADTNLDGLIAPNQLRRILDHVGIHMLDWDFDKFLDKIEKINGMVLYTDFLAKFTDNHKSQALRRHPNSRSTSSPKSTSQLLAARQAPLVSEQKIKDMIYQRYQGMMKTFLGLDYKRSGYVSSQEFRSCLSQHGITQLLTQEELSNLITKHGVEENGRISYTNFLQHFMVTMRGRETGTLGWTQSKSLSRPLSGSQSSGDLSSGSRGHLQNHLRISPSPISRNGAPLRSTGSGSGGRVPIWKRNSGSTFSGSKQSLTSAGGSMASLLKDPNTAGGDDTDFVMKARHLHALLKPTIIEIWKPLRQEFKNKSVSSARKGEINQANFRKVLKFNGLEMTEEDFGVLTKVHKSPFDMSGNYIKYDQFLKSCLGAQPDWL